MNIGAARVLLHDMDLVAFGLRRNWSTPPSPCARGRTVPVGLDKQTMCERGCVAVYDGMHTGTRSSTRTSARHERGAPTETPTRPGSQEAVDAQRQPVHQLASYAKYGHADLSGPSQCDAAELAAGLGCGRRA